MKLNKIHDDLTTLYRGKEIKTTFGFTFEHEDKIERCMNLFRSGYWSAAPFAFENYNNFAIKLTPGKELNDSQIVAKNVLDFRTISPDLKSFISMSWLRFLNDIEVINDEIKENWKSLEELSLPFREYAQSLNSLAYLKAYINDEDRLKNIGNPEYYEAVYLDFWNHYYNTPEQKEFASLIQKLANCAKYLPNFEVKDYGIWTVRAYNALLQRAYSYDLFDLEEENKAAYYWQGFMQTHGFDAESYTIEILPSTSARSGSQIEATIGYANPERIYQFPTEMQKHPLFAALEQIIKSSKSYDGQAHIKAAKVIDEKLGDPVMAWNALVSAGYWSGINFNEPNIEAWNAAINLSKKHGWIEINEILKDQLAFYNHYKIEI